MESSRALGHIMFTNTLGFIVLYLYTERISYASSLSNAYRMHSSNKQSSLTSSSLQMELVSPIWVPQIQLRMMRDAMMLDGGAMSMQPPPVLTGSIIHRLDLSEDSSDWSSSKKRRFCNDLAPESEHEQNSLRRAGFFLVPHDGTPLSSTSIFSLFLKLF